jgi:hypothetical protein
VGVNLSTAKDGTNRKQAMRLIIRTLVILGGVFFVSQVLPAFVTLHPAISFLLPVVFAAIVPELEKKVG